MPTIVTFPGGATVGAATVLRVDPHERGTVVVVDSTPFHPVDHTWPDQPADSGVIRSGVGVGADSGIGGGATAGSVVVAEAVMAALNDDGVLAVGPDIPVKRGTEGWTWLVGHVVADAAPWLAPGAAVSPEVDSARRDGLSRGHTACHLASLALDLAVADLWRKDAGADALGNPDFEGRANQSSRIHADGAVDEYRLGKSLRKAGFDTAAFAASLAEREARANAQLATWVASGAASRVETDGTTIVDRRRWRCSLPEGEAVIPCGGTHVRSLGEFASISVSLGMPDPQMLVMTTTAVGAH